MKRRIVAAMLGAVAAFAGMPAHAASGYFDITCPDHWPGAADKGARLSYSRPWLNTRTMLEADDYSIPYTGEGSVLLDCAYGAAPPGSRQRGGAFSDLRLTIQVPGLPQRCGQPSGTSRSSWCTAESAYDGTIGPIRIHIAQRPTLDTTLLGFGLRLGEDRLRAIAAHGGFTCTEAPGLLHCAKATDRIDVVIKDGQSVAVHWLMPEDQPGSGGAYDRVVYRFGLRRSTADDSPGRPDVWQEPNSPVRVTFLGGGNPMVLTLEDIAALK